MVESTPLISIVLLSLLRQTETARCIESINTHTDVPFEIIVVDMGKSVTIVEWLKQLNSTKSNIQVVYNTQNVGTSKGRNQGIQLAKGDWVVFLDNDTEVTQGWITQLLNVSNQNSLAAALGSKVISYDEKVMNAAKFIKADYLNNKLTEIGLEFLTDYNASHPDINIQCEVPWYPTTCLMVKRKVLDSINGFDESFILCEEDKDLSLRISALGGKILYVPSSVIIHHHNQSDSDYARIRNNSKILMSDIKTFEKKWNTKVFIRHSRTYLHNKGMSDAAIDRVKNLSPFNKIVEDELKLNQLIVTVTNHCNHACGFCYYHENLNLANNDLTLDEYQKISESIGNLNVLWITGGEPFLQKNLSEICKIFVTNNNVAQIFIPTNGSLPERIVEYTEKILDQNPDVRLTLMFSLEGTEDLHDAIHNRKGAFLQVKESIKRINFLRVKFLKKGRIFSILLNTVVSSKNVHNIGELMEFTRKNLMIDAHSLSPMRGQGQDPLCLPPTGDEMKAIYKQAKFYFEFYTKKSKLTQEHTDAYLAWMERRYSIWSNVLNGAGLPFDCMAGELIGVLEPDGGLRVCELKPIVANIRDFDYNFPKAWFSSAVENNRLTVKGCSCTHACFLNASDDLQAI